MFVPVSVFRLSLSNVFSWSDLGSTITEVKCPSHGILLWYMLPLQLTTGNVILITWSRWYLLGFTTVKLLFTSCYILWKLVKFSPYSRGEKLSSNSWKGAYLHRAVGFFCRRFILPPYYLFIDLFISVWTHGYPLYSFGMFPSPSSFFSSSLSLHYRMVQCHLVSSLSQP